MASVYKECDLAVPIDFAWQAVSNFGDVHRQLAQGFVISSTLAGNIRTIAFANGMVAKEQLITVDAAMHRLVYRAISERLTHHSASMQLRTKGDELTQFLWITDILPEGLVSTIAPMMDAGIEAIRHTLENNYHQRQSR